MGKLSNALQGKLNKKSGAGKGRAENQLDLFSTLADRMPSSPKVVSPSGPEEESAPPKRPEPEMILPPSGPPPDDVSADVRAVLSESSQVTPVEPDAAAAETRPPLRTGVYRRPRRSVAPRPTAPPPRRPARPRLNPFKWIRAWFAGVELNRRLVSLVVVAIVLVALVAFWTACPRQWKARPGTVVDLREIHRDPNAPVASPEGPAPVAPAPEATAPPSGPAEPRPAADWKVQDTEATQKAGILFVRFTEPVFISTDKISRKGMTALKAVAQQLVAMESGARIVVTGYTDNEPLSKPSARFKSNADIAAARAKTAVDHLRPFSRANKQLVFEAVTGDPARAPYPNDTPRNRRLNRTITLEVTPAP